MKSDMECSSSNISSLLNISDVCLENPEEPFCFPQKLNPLSTPTSIWCIVNAIVGFAGNLLTLLAIPFAARRRKFNLHKNWNTNLYILNLAFADLLYCMINLPLYSYAYITKGWSLGPELCKITTGFRYVNAFADWMSLAIIALSRCFHLTTPSLGKKLFAGKSGFVVVILIWIYANLLLVPLYIPQLKIGTFGYNCLIGKCDFLPYDNNHVFPRVILYGIGFSIPCGIITLSYITIWYNVWTKNRYLKKNGPEQMKRIITNREIRTNWTIFLVCFCYFLFVSPIALVNILDPDGDHPEVHLGFFCLYWLQYSLNFFIYAARSRQFKKAYKYFLQNAWRTLCCQCSNKVSTTIVYLPSGGRKIPAVTVSALLHSLSKRNHAINHSLLALPGSLVSSYGHGQAIVIMQQSGPRRGSLGTTMGLTTNQRSRYDDDSSFESESGVRWQSQVFSLHGALRSRFKRKRASSY